MNIILIIVAAIIIACVLSSKLSSKSGMPVLLFFILLGMLVGSDGLFKVPFEDYHLTEQICSIALIFIMFYGGFGTKWSAARPIALRACLLSSLGTVFTAGLVGLFCHWGLGIALLESFLIGAVISSTDAASVFSILRSKRLNLCDNTASLLEVESGSNDPFSYMLTIIALALMGGTMSGGEFAQLLFAQIILGILFGVAIALLTRQLFWRVDLSSSGLRAIFMVAVAILSYAAPSIVGGNGYLSVYIAGIILGNSAISKKQELVHFFDGANGLMQMLLFFTLGLLSFPSRLPDVALPAFGIALFLTFIARPLAVFAILTPFRSHWRQSLLVSWAGLRGAASIVFSIMAVINPALLSNDVFHIVFFIVLYSILFQGTLLPLVAKKLHMTDDTANVLHTFNDYMDETPLQNIQFSIPPSHPWVGKCVDELSLPPQSLLVLLVRGHEKIAPHGKIELQAGDTLVLSGQGTSQTEPIQLVEKQVENDSTWVNKTVAEISLRDTLIIMIKRHHDVLIPKGDTLLQAQDVLVIMDRKKLW